MDPLEIRKILIIQTAFIGDVILASSVIENLLAIRSDYRIDFLLRKGNESLLENHPAIGRIYCWDKKKSKHKNLFKLLIEVRKEKYDLVINLQRFTSSGLFTAICGANITLGFDKNPFSFLFDFKGNHHISNQGKDHEIDRNLSLLTLLGFPIKVRALKLYSSEADKQFIKQYQSTKYVVLAPASVWFTKQFPRDKWISFLKIIPKNLQVLILGAAADYDLSQEIISASEHQNCINLCGQLSFLQSMELMKNAVRCFVNDSAPLHLASAANARTTALFCSTVPEFGFGPLSSNSVVIQTDKHLDCRPCGLHGKKECPEKHFKCAYEIDENRILQTIEEY